MYFRKIDHSNYLDCIKLKVREDQKYFVADNAFSLCQSFFEKGLYTLGIYHEDCMVGFLLYDYDETIPGWSLSRLMIGQQFQGKGYGQQAVHEFLEYLTSHYDVSCLYISVSLNNQTARRMYEKIGFLPLKNIEYDFDDVHYQEVLMVKTLTKEQNR